MAAGNCSAYMRFQTTIVDGRRWRVKGIDRFRREIFLRARAQGWDTLQYTHRSENVFRFEIVDLRIPNGSVTQLVPQTQCCDASRRGRSLPVAPGTEEPDVHIGRGL